jgi:hypothetical protein
MFSLYSDSGDVPANLSWQIEADKLFHHGKLPSEIFLWCVGKRSTMNWKIIHPKRKIHSLRLAAAIVATVIVVGQPVLAGGDTQSQGHQSQNYDFGEEYDYDQERYEDEYDDRAVQSTTELTQQFNLIGACRYSPNSLDVYRDAARTQRILTIVPYTELSLTGVVGTSVAEIYSPALGWINTATVEDCDDAPDPDPDPDPDEQACYEILTTVTVRSGPDGSYPGIGQIRRGGIAYATTNPPTASVSSDRRRWIEIFFPRQGRGWFSLTGPGGAGQNAVRLPDEECD